MDCEARPPGDVDTIGNAEEDVASALDGEAAGHVESAGDGGGLEGSMLIQMFRSPWLQR